MKTQELGHFLLGKFDSIGFMEPALRLERTDNLELRRRILELTQNNARKLGIGKSAIHYLRKNAARSESFKIYKPIMRKLAVSHERSLANQEL